MTRIVHPSIAAKETQKICQMLTDAGHQAFLVGGCIRNALLGAPVNDIDVATDARPDRVTDLAKAAGYRAVPTGIEHGTVTVLVDSCHFEVTTYRRDIETDGRRAVVAYADSVIEDARRRDFTMNALYAEADGTLHDPLDGLRDLQARRVRFIDDADARIKEDYLRILRFFRFHAWYGDQSEGLDPDGLAACADNLDGIGSLSKERIGAEMKKLLSAPDPAPSVASMDKSGVLTRLISGADSTVLPVLVHQEQLAGVDPEPIRRLAALGGTGQAAALRLSRDEEKRLQAMSGSIGTMEPAAVLGYRLGKTIAMDVILLRAAIFGSCVDPRASQEVTRGAMSVFPVKADDLMPEYTGPKLGKKLKQLELDWIASDFQLSKKQLLT